MADDNTLRTYRSNDPRRHTEPASQSAADPLAELARLIGQSDPFHDTGRDRTRDTSSRVPEIPQSPSRPAAPADWRQHVERPNYEAMREQPMPPPAADFPPLAPAFDDGPRLSMERDPYLMATPQPAYDNRDGRRDPDFSMRDDRYADAPEQDRFHDHADLADRHEHAYADDAYDDPPQRRRQGSRLVTAVVLIGCAMLGTAGAYGYRTYSSGGSSGAAPVIVADTSPSKVVTSDSKSRSQERFSGTGNEERLVPREEQPVTIQPGSGTPPRVVFPSPVPTGGAPSTVTPASPPTTTGSTKDSSGGTEPKRVRTLTIRPDGDPSGRPIAPASESAPKTPSAKVAAPSRGTAPHGAPAPLSLDPNAAGEAAQAPRSAPKLASAPATGGAGGYLVQVSSQRTEAEAKSSYRSLQTKYAQLRSKDAIVRRAELGKKGTYYRAFVGPFGTSGEASQFCESLKSAGGQCIIIRN